MGPPQKRRDCACLILAEEIRALILATSSYSPLAIALATLVAGCAAGEPGALAGGGPPSAPPAAPDAAVVRVAQKSEVQPGLQPDGTYVLSKAELELDCKKLTGRTLVRILQMRDHDLRNHSSVASQTAQKLVVPLFGGSQYGSDPEADYRRDRAMVEAYNRRLAEKRCKVFDLAKELQPRPAAETPVPKKP